MDMFEDDGVDNAAKVSAMIAGYAQFESAHMELSPPIRKWFNTQYDLGNVPMCVMIAHVGTAIDSLAELLGVDD